MQAKSKTSLSRLRPRKRLDTRYRTKLNQLQQQLFTEGVVSRKLLDAVPSPILIINDQWQVVYANPAVVTLLGGSRTGLLEGGPFHCLHARQPAEQAGQSRSCQICGVARALSRSLKGEETREDCHLTCDLSGTGAPLDIQVWATPLEFHGEHFSILSLIDISDRRRRQALANICFHDLLNTLTCIKGALAVLPDADVDDQAEVSALLERMTQGSIDEINNLRLLEQAQQKTLKAQCKTLQSRDFMESMQTSLQNHPAATDKTLRIALEAEDLAFNSDPQLLRRIVGNMAINALEATEPGGTVTLGCQTDRHNIRFWLHNDKHIPHEKQTLIFQPNASGKGHGRGFGTYSIKLLSAILGGEARFHTTKAEGTTFSVSFPL